MSETPAWMNRPWQDPVDLQLDRPHAARMYDFLLGGKTNYLADRKAATQLSEELPTLALTARVNRAFMHRLVRWLVEAGIRQFMDIGTGIPTSPNLHEVAQGIAPEARVVYADNDPIVLVHSRALHTSDPAGRTAYVQADAADPAAILSDPAVREALDWQQPMALTMLLLLHWLPRDTDPYAIVRHLVDALPSGSFLAISYATADFGPAGWGQGAAKIGISTRPKQQVAALFDGLELVEPGIVVPQQWHPAAAPTLDIGRPDAVTDIDVPVWVGVARKP